MVDKKEEKPELEREYIIPLRKQVMKVPKYRRAKKAIRTIKEFLAKHMRVENRDIRKVKINTYLNQEIWFRGIKHPPAKIKVRAKKISGIVFVELAEIPKVVQYKIDREKRRKEQAEKSKEVKKEEKPEEKKEEKTEEQKKEEQEKEKATQEAGLKTQKQEAKTEKHTSKQKQPKQAQIHRMAMQR